LQSLQNGKPWAHLQGIWSQRLTETDYTCKNLRPSLATDRVDSITPAGGPMQNKACPLPGKYELLPSVSVFWHLRVKKGKG
jgi:hypothetical protein